MHNQVNISISIELEIHIFWGKKQDFQEQEILWQVPVFLESWLHQWIWQPVYFLKKNNKKTKTKTRVRKTETKTDFKLVGNELLHWFELHWKNLEYLLRCLGSVKNFFSWVVKTLNKFKKKNYKRLRTKG